MLCNKTSISTHSPWEASLDAVATWLIYSWVLPKKCAQYCLTLEHLFLISHIDIPIKGLVEGTSLKLYHKPKFKSPICTSPRPFYLMDLVNSFPSSFLLWLHPPAKAKSDTCAFPSFLSYKTIIILKSSMPQCSTFFLLIFLCIIRLQKYTLKKWVLDLNSPNHNLSHTAYPLPFAANAHPSGLVIVNSSDFLRPNRTRTLPSISAK